MIEFDYNNQTIRINKPDVFAQMDLVRKVAPFMNEILDLASGKAGAFNNMAYMIAMQNKDDFNSFVKNCLSLAMIKTGDHYSAVMAKENLMFDNLDLAILGKIVYKVLEVHALPFLFGLLVPQTPDSPEATTAATANSGQV